MMIETAGRGRRAEVSARVIAIGLDSVDPVQLEKLLDGGYLPNLARLRGRGAYGRLTGVSFYRAELVWTTFLTASEPEDTGYWSPLAFDPATYAVEEVGAYDFRQHRPFYALGDEARVAVFDVPQAILDDDVDGIQVLAWGAHAPQTGSLSSPPGLLEELNRAHGKHPALHRDHASHWNPVAMARLRRSLAVGIERRVEICLDLLARERWDLFLTVFGETHSAGHYLWHLTESEHPLHAVSGADDDDPMLAVFRAVDDGIGAIADAAGDDAAIVVFSLHGMESNSMDLPSLVFLPELLYRLEFPGAAGLARTSEQGPPPEVVSRPKSLGWYRAVWRLRHEEQAWRRGLRRVLPIRAGRVADRAFGLTPGPSHPHDFGELFYQPAIWYSPLWPRMRAFALPSFSEGCVRINLAGREANGTVRPEDYDAVCDELTEAILALRSARSGEPLASRVIRTRASALDDDANLPDADLIVAWNPEPVDVVDTGGHGRIGPVPYGRTGSHVSRGFMLASGPGIQPGSQYPVGDIKDVAPTLLGLMGVGARADLAGTALTPG
jgi:predicted AlkP superfamily phosphohydrolase/phosphomutase